VGFDGTEFRANDDGEPSSTAGKPILGQIDCNGLTNTFICVIRYYGGINLGTGGLIVAYREAAADALANSEIEEKFIEEEVTYSFSYPMMNAVMRIIKDMNPRIINQVFDNTCEVTLSIRKGKADELRTRLNKLSFD
jgi:thymidylate synthase